MATETAGPIFGGIIDIPGAANSIEIQNLAHFAVDEHNKKENSVLEFVKVISAKQQVVAGTNYFITLEAKDGETKKEYEAKVWVREWLNSKELVEFKPVSVASTQIGGITDIPGAANSIEIQNLARFAVDEHNKKQNANLEFVRVINAKQQIVEGFIYYITLEAKDGEITKEYETKVWVRSWLNSKEVLEFKPVTLGGITDVPGAANSVEIQDLARFAVDEHNKKQNSVLEFVKVISAKQQLVAGTNYFITLEAKDGEIKKEYEAKVWVREWLNSKELLEFKPVSVASTQIGGITDIPGAANSIEIQNLARFAVDEHNKKKHANLEFVRVVSAKKQVVEGFIYYINLEAKHGEKKHVYETQVWVREWLNSKEVLEFKPVTVNPLSVSA